MRIVWWKGVLARLILQSWDGDELLRGSIDPKWIAERATETRQFNFHDVPV